MNNKQLTQKQLKALYKKHGDQLFEHDGWMKQVFYSNAQQIFYTHNVTRIQA